MFFVSVLSCIIIMADETREMSNVHTHNSVQAYIPDYAVCTHSTVAAMYTCMQAYRSTSNVHGHKK